MRRPEENQALRAVVMREFLVPKPFLREVVATENYLAEQEEGLASCLQVPRFLHRLQELAEWREVFCQ